MVAGPIQRRISNFRFRLARRRVREGGYRFEEVPACLCGCSDLAPARTGEDLGRPLRLVLCRRCGLGRLSPRLAAADLSRYYRSDYRLLIRGTPTVDDAWFDRGVRRGRALIEFLSEREMMPRAGASVLEVGTAAGGILAAFRDQGYAVAGSDLDRACVAFARSKGLDVVHGETLGSPELAPAGLIVLSHLIEHLPDPLTSLAALAPYSDHRTVLYVEVPGLRAERDAARVPKIPHLYYYDLTTLEWLLASAGWRLVEGDESVRALFRRGEAEPRIDPSNFSANLSLLAAPA